MPLPRFPRPHPSSSCIQHSFYMDNNGAPHKHAFNINLCQFMSICKQTITFCMFSSHVTRSLYKHVGRGCEESRDRACTQHGVWLLHEVLEFNWFTDNWHISN